MTFEDGTNLAPRAVLFFSARTRNGGVAVRAAVVATATATMHASNVTFYQYEGRALDHGWLHNCAGFHALRHGASDRFIQEQGLTHSLEPDGPARGAEAARLVRARGRPRQEASHIIAVISYKSV